ncbi:ABC transporter permease [Dehalococcoidia bacterium]|nr:ABC transporter permease [Dehalococcoidia bacterium]
MSLPTGISSAAIALNRRSRLAEFFGRLGREKPLGTACGIVILTLMFVATFADFLIPFPYDEIHLEDRLQGPSAQYLLGTDQLGQDVLSRLIYGARISFLVAIAVSTIRMVLSTLVGGISGFLGGRFDIIVQRFVDAWNVFPGLLLLLTIMSIVGRGLPQIILVLGVAGGISDARILRSAVIGIKENVYFEAAEAIGNSRWRTFMRHVIPNIMPVIIIIFSISIGGVILSLAALGFLGYGLPAQIPDWGGMLSTEGRSHMERAPWLALFPGLLLTITVWSLNMFGDALRDLLDPRLRGG